MKRCQYHYNDSSKLKSTGGDEGAGMTLLLARDRDDERQGEVNVSSEAAEAGGKQELVVMKSTKVVSLQVQSGNHMYATPSAI